MRRRQRTAARRASTPSRWISRRLACSIGSITSPVRGSTRVAAQRLGELPVGVGAAGAAGFDQQVTRPLGQQRPQRRQFAGLVDVDPQEAAVRDRVLVAAAVGPRRDADERLLARTGASPRGVGTADDLLGVREQRREPVALAGGSAGQVVLGPPPAVERELAVGAARAGGELDELGGLGVQHPELDRPVAGGRQRAGEDAAVGEPHAAAQACGLGAHDPHRASGALIGGRAAAACRARGGIGGGQAAHRCSCSIAGRGLGSGWCSRTPSWKACCSAA